jgi:8-oxo-dGTP diphosphatase
MAAGGIVIREGTRPLIAVVQRRKDNGWVLPKGKLKRKERARTAARREVVEETGHQVTAVHEFLGAISYASSGRPKIVYFWKMKAVATQAYRPLREIKAVQWLSLNSAVEKLSRPIERAFLCNIGRKVVQSDRTPVRKRKTVRKLSSLHRTPRHAKPSPHAGGTAMGAILPILFRQAPLGFRGDGARGIVPSIPR